MTTISSSRSISGDQISFPNQKGEVLTGDIYLPADGLSAGVVFGHCFTCSRHTRVLLESCQELYRNGIAALRFDFSGNGQSGGDFSETTYSKHVSEMKLAIKLLKQYGIKNIGVAGHSMGAAVSLLTASTSPEVKAVCTLAGRYSSLDVSGLLSDSSKMELKQTGRMNFVSRGRSLVLSEQFFNDVASHDLAATISKLAQPLLAIHGDLDDIIPVKEVYFSQKHKPVNTEIAVITGADHMFSDSEHRQQVAQRLTSWFKKQLSQKFTD